MRNRITRPSPALVISIVALFVALGGTGYAAVQLPKASVGAKHLKKNSVSSAKVKNSSLLLGDFKASERTKLHGAAGAPGRGRAASRGSRGLRVGTGRRQRTNGTEAPGPGHRARGRRPGSRDDRARTAIQGIPGPTGVEQVVVRTTALDFSGGQRPETVRSSLAMRSARPVKASWEAAQTIFPRLP